MNQLNTTARTGRLKRTEVHQGSGPPNSGVLSSLENDLDFIGTSKRRRLRQHAIISIPTYVAGTLIDFKTMTPAAGGLATKKSVAGAQASFIMH